MLSIELLNLTTLYSRRVAQIFIATCGATRMTESLLGAPRLWPPSLENIVQMSAAAMSQCYRGLEDQLGNERIFGNRERWDARLNSLHATLKISAGKTYEKLAAR